MPLSSEANQLFEAVLHLLEREDISPQSFSIYEQMLAMMADAENDFQGKYHEEWASLNDSEKQAIHRKKETALNNFSFQFMEYVVNSDNPAEVLFDVQKNLNYTSEEITKCYRKIVKRFQQFHPDKQAANANSYYFLIQDFHSLLNQTKTNLIENIENERTHFKGATWEFLSVKAQVEFGLTNDYNNLIKKNGRQIRYLKDETYFGMSERVLREYRKQHGTRAYNLYRETLLSLEKENPEDIENCIRLRKNMALSLYLIENLLEAQLYALSSLKLCEELHSMDSFREKVRELSQLLNKIKGMVPTRVAQQNNNNNQNIVEVSPNEEDPNNPEQNMQIVFYADKTLAKISARPSIRERREISKAVKEDLVEVSRELTSPPRGLASTNLHQLYRDDAKSQAKLQYAKTLACGAAGGLGLTLAGASSVLSIILFGAFTGGIAAGILAPAFGIVALAAVSAGAIAAYKAIKAKREADLREGYNDIIKLSLDAYDAGEYEQFLIHLARPPYDKAFKRSLLQFNKEKKILNINPEAIITNMSKREFRVDTIACILFLIAEVLLSRKIKLDFQLQKELDCIAIKIYRTLIDNQELTTQAVKLDNAISKRTKSQNNKKTKLSNFFMSFYYSIPKEYIQDACEMPFTFRLEEMRTFARLNLLILSVFDDVINESSIKKLIDDLEKHLKKSQLLFSMFQSRIEAVGDFIRVFGIKATFSIGADNAKFSDRESVIPALSYPEASLLDDEWRKWLQEIDTALKINDRDISNSHKIQLLEQKGQLFKLLADEHVKKTDKKNELIHLYSMKSVYENVLALDNKNENAYVNCIYILYRMHKYTQAIKLMDRCEKLLMQNPDYIWLKASVFRKLGWHSQARLTLNTLLQVDLNQQFSCQERHKEKIENYRKEIALLKPALERQIAYEKITNQQVIQEFYLPRATENLPLIMEFPKSAENNPYYILSIDGGGIRGIIPLVWLHELECRTRLPVSQLFSMMAGTSTGGMIACGLATPALLNQTTTKPKYRAADLLDLYVDKARTIFTPRGNLVSRLFHARYTDEGRLSVCNDCFGDAQLNDVLTEVVVPAVDMRDINSPYIFSSQKAKMPSSTENYSLVDVAMATSAAPTFFEAYCIQKRQFVDGGVQANHPGLDAYNQAIKSGVDQENIRMISMGTGDCVPEPYNVEKNKGLLFWGKNISGVTLPANQGRADETLRIQLKDSRYSRWQPYLDKPRRLDDCSEEGIRRLIEVGETFLEEMYASDDNEFNKVVEEFDMRKPGL